ncbi:EYxxD motif small membrane protein [Alteribacter salitolerans]
MLWEYATDTVFLYLLVLGSLVTVFYLVMKRRRTRPK